MRTKRGFTTFGPAFCSAAAHRGLLGLVLLLALALGAMPAAAQKFDVESFTLANGMQVVVLPNHRVPAVTQTVWYRIGAADDPRGKSGLAHFLEHLMFKGTGTTAPGEFSKLVAQAGATTLLRRRTTPAITRPSRAIGSNC